MSRPKRNSALRARTAVQELSSSAFPPELEQHKLELEEEEEEATFSVKSDSSEEEVEEQASEDEESSLSEEVEAEDKSEEGDKGEESEDALEEEEDVVRPKGRPKKGSAPRLRPKQYVKLSEYKTYGAGPLPLSTWKKAVASARPMKRAKRLRPNLERTARPPTDLLVLEEPSQVIDLPAGLASLLSEEAVFGTPGSFDAPPNDRINGSFKGQKFSLSSGESVTLEGSIFARSQKGPVTGLAWCHCCGRRLASSSYPSTDFKDYLNKSNPLQSSITIWTADEKNFSLSLSTVIWHNFGVSRDLQWFPFKNNKSGTILVGSFGDQTTRIFHVPLDEAPLVTLSSGVKMHTFSNTSCFTWCKSPSHFVTGTFSGEISFWDLDNSEEPKCTYTTKVTEKPIFTLSWCPTDDNLLVIGSYDKSLFIFDKRRPHEIHRYHSEPIPNALWCKEGIISWDVESSIRLLPYNPSETPQRHIAILNFGAAATQVASSSFHNVMAASAADGAVHFFIMRDLKTRIFSHEANFLRYQYAEDTVSVESSLEYAPRPQHFGIYDLATSVTKLAWCNSSEMPGLLAIGTGSGLIILTPLEEFLAVFHFGDPPWMPRARFLRGPYRILLLLVALVYILFFRKMRTIHPDAASMEAYKQEYERSIKDPEEFWRAKALETLSWTKKFTKVYSGDFGQGIHRWFEDGMLNVAYNCVDRHAKEDPSRIALIWEGDEPGLTRHITYLKLQEETSRLAHYLVSQGIIKGDTVTIYMPMVPEAVFSMLACARIGATHNVVFAGFSAESLADRIIDSGSRLLITADEGRRGGKTISLKHIVDKAIKLSHDRIDRVLLFHRTGGSAEFHPQRDHWWHEQVPQQPDYFEPVPISSEHPLFMLYTSGSTGKPKGLVHSSAGYLLYAAATHKHVFDIQKGDIFGCLADVGWITGHSYIVYGPLCNGVSTVIFESTPVYPNPSRYWDTIQKHKITQLYTAPTVIRALRRFGEEPLEGYDLSSLRVIGTVGEPISPDAWTWYAEAVGKNRCAVVDTYWQTETGGHIITPLATLTITKPGSATLPFYGIEANIIDPKTGKIILEREAEGILVISKPWPGIARTVKGNHQKYFDTYFKDYPGHYFTGDGAHRDKDGYIWIQGRVDDVINVSGHRLSTAEIESALGHHPVCAEAAVLGSPDPITGQSIWAFVIPKGKIDPNNLHQIEHDLKATVRQMIGAFAVPKHVVVIEDLPKTRSGKIMRRVIRKILEGTTDKVNLGDLSTINNPEIIDRLLSIVHGKESH